MTRKVVNYNEDSESESEDFEDGLDFDQDEDHDESIDGIRRRRSLENQVSAARDLLENSLVPDPTEEEPRNHFTPTRVQFPVNAPQFHTLPENMPNNPPPAAPIVAFEDENGDDEIRALQEACRNVERVVWDPNDVKFFFSKVEIKMSAVGVKKQYTKFQVLSTILPKKVEDEMKSLLVRSEAEFPERNAYKLLKTEIMRIFGPKPESAVDRALSRVIVDTPSQLARALVNDLCKTQLRGCQCCPPIVAALWKRQLSSTVRAGIAHCQFNADTFNQVVQLADDIHATARPVGTVAAVTGSLDETLPALQSSVVPEVAATSRGGRGRGRGGRGRGGRGGGGRGGQSNQSNQNQSQGQNQARARSGTKHPDLPPGEWSGCNMHFRWGKGAFFCSEPSTCPWKNIYAQKPAKQ